MNNNKTKERLQRAIERGIIPPHLICDDETKNISGAKSKRRKNGHMAPSSLSHSEMFRGPGGS